LIGYLQKHKGALALDITKEYEKLWKESEEL